MTLGPPDCDPFPALRRYKLDLELVDALMENLRTRGRPHPFQATVKVLE